jgi:hypothetical protein
MQIAGTACCGETPTYRYEGLVCSRYGENEKFNRKISKEKKIRLRDNTYVLKDNIKMDLRDK